MEYTYPYSVMPPLNIKPGVRPPKTKMSPEELWDWKTILSFFEMVPFLRGTFVSFRGGRVILFLSHSVYTSEN